MEANELDNHDILQALRNLETALDALDDDETMLLFHTFAAELFKHWGKVSHL